MRHGYALLALLLFLQALGLPVPGALALLTAGAAIAYGKFSPVPAFGMCVLFIVTGDCILFLLGRYAGWALLGLLCRLSANPETCILRSAASFYRWGKKALLFAKFIPGINAMSPPLAGSMKMRIQQFLPLDVLGASLYILVYGGVGFIFSDFLREITHGLRSFGQSMEILLGLGVAAYAAYRIWMYRKSRMYKVVPRVSVEELVGRLANDPKNAFVVDVRSHGYYDPDAERIKGSVRIEPNNLPEEIRKLSSEKDIFLYCT
jgi:membrane protein DedA with SNARE-associated domain